MKKKILSLLLALAMTAMLLAGCGASGSSEPTAGGSSAAAGSTGNASTGESSEAGGDTADAPAFKIGFAYSSNADELGKQMYDSLKVAVEATGGELMFLEWPGTGADAIYESVQNLVEAGCDGVIASVITPSMIELCDEKGVALIQNHSRLADESLVELAKNSDYYIGSLVVDDYLAGKEMVYALSDSGCTQIAYLSLPAGLASQHDERVRGIEDAVEELDSITMVTNYRGVEPASGMRQIMTAFPEIDGLCITYNDGSVLGAIYADGLQDKVKVASVDFADGMTEYLSDGTLVFAAGGHGGVIELTFALLYNFLTGNNMIEDNTQSIEGTYIYVKTAADYEDYQKYFMGDMPIYTAEEVRSMLVAYNPDATLEDIVGHAQNYSLDDMIARHKDMF